MCFFRRWRMYDSTWTWIRKNQKLSDKRKFEPWREKCRTTERKLRNLFLKSLTLVIYYFTYEWTKALPSSYSFFLTRVINDFPLQYYYKERKKRLVSFSLILLFQNPFRLEKIWTCQASRHLEYDFHTTIPSCQKYPSLLSL